MIIIVTLYYGLFISMYTVLGNATITIWTLSDVSLLKSLD
jgi:hypothetical protein